MIVFPKLVIEVNSPHVGVVLADCRGTRDLMSASVALPSSDMRDLTGLAVGGEECDNTIVEPQCCQEFSGLHTAAVSPVIEVDGYVIAN